MLSLDQLRDKLRQRIGEIKSICPKSQSRNVAIVIKEWYDKLLDWLGDDNDNQPPGPIDNGPLMSENEVLSSLQYKQDFEIVEAAIWPILADNFGGGPAIFRRLSIPASPGSSCVLLNPISFEMMTQKGPKYKTCAPDWRLIDMKKFLCLNIQVKYTDYQFCLPNSSSSFVDERLTIGEYQKLHGNKIKLTKILSDAASKGSSNSNNLLCSTMPHQTFADSSFRVPLPTISVRSGSCLGVSFPKPVGLVNLGNTCFFNAAMQCLVRVKPLVDYIFSPDFDVNINKTNPLGSGGTIASAFKTFLQDMSTISKTARDPGKFRSALIKKYHSFANYGQHDSQEVVGAILDGLHEDLNQSLSATGHKVPPDLSPRRCYAAQNKSIIVDLFQGYLASSLICPKCNGKNVVYDPFMFLSLPVPKRSYPPVSLEECLRQFNQEEELDANNLWKCPKCGQNVRAKKKLCVNVAPTVLIIHLKRFYGAGFFATKIESDVRYPNEIKVEQVAEKGNGTYYLFGAIFHSGGMMSGHYTAAAIDFVSGNWYNFNDSDAREMRPQEAHSPRAYILFYQLKKY